MFVIFPLDDKIANEVPFIAVDYGINRDDSFMLRINAYGPSSQTKTAKKKSRVKASASGEKVSCC